MMQGISEYETARVSMFARLIPLSSYGLAAVGGGMSAFVLLRVIEALRSSENAGIAAVSMGMAEATWPVLIALYSSLVIGFIGIVVAIVRLFMRTQKASPPAWFLIFPPVFGLIPALIFWITESILLSFILPGPNRHEGGIATVASTISMLIILAMVAGLVVSVVLLIASVMPFSARKDRKYGALCVMILAEIALAAAAGLFQYRIFQLYEIFQTRG